MTDDTDWALVERLVRMIQTRDREKARMTRRNPADALLNATKTFTVSVAHDGTTTVADVFTDDDFGGTVHVAQGKSRRKKGDARNAALGISLATGRAFEELAARERKFTDPLLGEGDE
jgi:hypothetical protein